MVLFVVIFGFFFFEIYNRPDRGRIVRPINGGYFLSVLFRRRRCRHRNIRKMRVDVIGGMSARTEYEIISELQRARARIVFRS